MQTISSHCPPNAGIEIGSEVKLKLFAVVVEGGGVVTVQLVGTVVSGSERELGITAKFLRGKPGMYWQVQLYVVELNTACISEIQARSGQSSLQSHDPVTLLYTEW